MCRAAQWYGDCDRSPPHPGIAQLLTARECLRRSRARAHVSICSGLRSPLAAQARADRMALFSVEDGLGSHDSCTVTAMFCRVRPCTCRCPHPPTPPSRPPSGAHSSLYLQFIMCRYRCKFCDTLQRVKRYSARFVRGSTDYLKSRAVAESSN
jgi:hypothetical protein